MGQRGLLDRLPVAHTAPITTIDWYSGGEEASHAISFQSSGSQSASSGGPDDYTGNTLGWVASAGLDRCVKVLLYLPTKTFPANDKSLDMGPHRPRRSLTHAQQTHIRPPPFIPHPPNPLAPRLRMRTRRRLPRRFHSLLTRRPSQFRISCTREQQSTESRQ
jgi:hypothetical protein